MAVTVVGAGSADANSPASNAITPTRPTGSTDDFDVCCYGVRGAADDPTDPTPEWVEVLNTPAADLAAGRRVTAWYDVRDAIETNPTILSTGNSTHIARVITLAGVDTAAPVHATSAESNSGAGSGDVNVGPVESSDIAVPAGGAVVVVGARGDDATNVSDMTGDGLTWTTWWDVSTLGNDITLLVAVGINNTGSPVTVTDKTFTVTGGGTDWAGRMFSVSPAAGGNTHETASWQSSYTVKGHEVAAWQSSYTTRARQSTAWASSYQVAAHETATWVSSYLTHARQTTSWQSSYGVEGRNSTEWASSYAVRSREQATWGSSWITRSRETASWGSSYTTNGRGSASWASSYTTHARPTTTWQTSYSVQVTGATHETQTWQSSWTTNARVTQTWASSYGIAGHAQQSWASSYVVRVRDTTAWQSSYRVSQRDLQGWASSYAVHAHPTITWQSSYVIDGTRIVSLTLSASPAHTLTLEASLAHTLTLATTPDHGLSLEASLAHDLDLEAAI